MLYRRILNAVLGCSTAHSLYLQHFSHEKFAGFNGGRQVGTFYQFAYAAPTLKGIHEMLGVLLFLVPGLSMLLIISSSSLIWHGKLSYWVHGRVLYMHQRAKLVAWK